MLIMGSGLNVEKHHRSDTFLDISAPSQSLHAHFNCTSKQCHRLKSHESGGDATVHTCHMKVIGCVQADLKPPV